MKKTFLCSAIILFISCSIHLNGVKAQSCNCNISNPCINGNVWFGANLSAFLKLDFLNQYSGNSYNTFQNYEVVSIKSIPYVTYGSGKYSDLDIDQTGGRYDMDIYFPGAFTSPLNSSNKYPVLLFLPGGGFRTADRTLTFADQCDSLAARGFIVATMSYRTNPLLASCNDSVNNYVVARAIQDVRLALRSLQAISQPKPGEGNEMYYYDDHEGTTKGLSLPFMDMDNIILGGTSAGSITALTTAYYDACDINASLNYNDYLSDHDLYLDINSTPVCDGIHVPFDLDEPYRVDTLNLKDQDKVDFYFDQAVYSAAPMNKIKAVFDIKGGVPEPGIDYCYRCFSYTSSTPDPTLPGIDPKYIANHPSSPSDYIPLIGFQGINDGTVPYLSNYEYNYVIDGIPPNDNKVYDFCLDNYNGFLWGSGKIYDKLKEQGVTTQLYSEPGGSHGFDDDDKSFIYTQTALFVHHLLCNESITGELDSVITFDVPSSEIGFDNNCGNTNTTVDLHFKITNTNLSATITKVDVCAKIVDVSANPNVVLLDQSGSVNTVEYVGTNKSNYVLPGVTSDYFIDGPLTIAQPVNSKDVYRITLTLSNPNGFGYTKYVAYNSNSNVLDVLTPGPDEGDGCFATITTEPVANYNPVIITPNPSSEGFTIHDLPAYGSVIIFDLTGRQMDSFRGSPGDIFFGESYKSGIYLAKEILSNGKMQIQKVIKTGN